MRQPCPMKTCSINRTNTIATTEKKKTNIALFEKLASGEGSIVDYFSSLDI
jgi:hypothetical protein